MKVVFHAYNLKHCGIRHWKGSDRTLCGIAPHWHRVTNEETQVGCQQCILAIRNALQKKFRNFREQSLLQR